MPPSYSCSVLGLGWHRHLAESLKCNLNVGESNPGLLFTVQQAQRMGRKCSSREEVRAALAAFLSLSAVSAFRKIASSGGNDSSKEEAEFPAVILQVALVAEAA